MALPTHRSLQPNVSFLQTSNWPFAESTTYHDSSPEDPIATLSTHSQCLSVEAALKDCAQLRFNQFALLVFCEEGEDRLFTSKSLIPYQREIFQEQFIHKFRRTVLETRTTSRVSNICETDIRGTPFRKLGRDSRQDHRKPQDSWHGRDSLQKVKRQCRRGYFSAARDPGYFNNGTYSQCVTQSIVRVRIGDEAEVEKFYVERFKKMQQSFCKILGKVFVKLIEPKKQTNYPYIKGDDKAPPWWPQTTGRNRVRHREPDHLLKPERVRLLVHILRMATERQSYSVKALEEAAVKAMSKWFKDEAHPENAAKEPLFQEIFQVAIAEEQYKKEGIGGDITFTPLCWEEIGIDSSNDKSVISWRDEEDSLVCDNIVPSPRVHQYFPPRLYADTANQSSGLSPLPMSHFQPHSEDQRGFNSGHPLFRDYSSGLPLHIPTDSYPRFQGPQQNLYDWQYSN